MKLQKQSTRKIDLSQINKTDNIRKQYDDIESLARSIERDGQLQPIGVVEQENGTFNMLYGFRRLNAFLFLCDEGKDFMQIEAKITTGDPAIIQLIENIHRDNLKSEEFEDALQALLASGLTQKEIAERLNIRQTRVSDALAARKTRNSMKKKNIDTSDLSTTAVSLMRSIPEEKQKEVVEKIKEKGSTVKAVKEVMDLKVCKNTDIPPHNPDLTQEECIQLTKKLAADYVKEIISENTPDDLPYTQISIREFLRLTEVKSIIATQKLIIQTKCESCGKEI